MKLASNTQHKHIYDLSDYVPILKTEITKECL